MDEKFVYAVYDRIEEANKAVQNLTNAGIPVSAISLYADDDVVEEANQSDSIVEIEELEDVESKSFWNRITDFFGVGDDNDENFPVDFKGYQEELDDDKILVVVDKTYEGEALSVDTTVNVMEENDPNHVETFTQNEDYPLPDKKGEANQAEFVAGDMGAETDYSKEYQTKHETGTQEELDERDYNITESIQYDEANTVAGDTSRETEDAESYYTNIETHRKTNAQDTEEAKVTYVENPAAEEKLRADRDQNAVAGDMGDSSDYSQYYQTNSDDATKDSSKEYHNEEYYLKGEELRLSKETEEKNREYKGVADIKRPVTRHSNNDPRLGEFEADMRRFDDNPPADEEGVNPEQFGAEDKGPRSFNTLNTEESNVSNEANQSDDPHQLGEFETEMRRHDNSPPSDEEGVNPDQYEDKK